MLATVTVFFFVSFLLFLFSPLYLIGLSLLWPQFAPLGLLGASFV